MDTTWVHFSLGGTTGRRGKRNSVWVWETVLATEWTAWDLWEYFSGGHQRGAGWGIVGKNRIHLSHSCLHAFISRPVQSNSRRISNTLSPYSPRWAAKHFHLCYFTKSSQELHGLSAIIPIVWISKSRFRVLKQSQLSPSFYSHI